MKRLPLLALVFVFAASSSIPTAVQRGMNSFRKDAMRAHDQFLASDLLEGRGPGTRGDDLAMQYIAAQFESYGLEPAGDNGTYYQRVPLLGVTMDASKTSLSFTKEGAAAIGPLKHMDEFVATDQTQQGSNTIDSDLVFVGHGVVAPEYRWDDYKGLDAHGKTLVMLVDDPPANPQEPDLFKGKTRTYYGRWTYKYEIGTAKGADGVILIHTDEAAGYPWSVVRNSWGSETSYVRLAPGAPALKIAAWITEKTAGELFKAAGLDLNALTRAAASRDFKPVALGYKLSGTIASRIRPFDTANVVAKLTGSDPKLRDEAIVYSAHHDHLGIGRPDDRGDTIYNGAIDNASGCAILLDLARVWANTTPKPKRSIYFAAVAAEEQGLLGSDYLGKHPPVPAGRIALDLNYDAVPELGRVKDVVLNGSERTTFYPTALDVTKALDLTIVPDPQPEQGHYYRSDHFSFGKVGIPAFSIEPGHDVVGKGSAWGEAAWRDYNEHRYHQPSDEFNPNWDWSEGVQMAQLGYWLGWDAANAASMPTWKPGDEFRAVRDRSLAAAR
ncbi:MAG TPA: M28 family peptidase [Thermoanaerobaculia bacterium]|nr:M28 family peptidase [Thermoanaerobaculia bacterium]